MDNKSKSKQAASKIRKLATKLRSDKPELSEKALSKLCQMAVVGKTYGEACASIFNVVIAGSSALIKSGENPVVRKMGASLIENVLGNFADRLQEVATLLESAGKEPAVVSAFESLNKAVAASEKAYERFANSSASLKETVESDDSDDEVLESEEPYKKSTKTHCEVCNEESDLIIDDEGVHVCVKHYTARIRSKRKN